jgi:uncharacterized membrane protein YkvA (DUF1232 family)
MMPLPNEVAGSIHLQYVAELPLEVTAAEPAFQMHAAMPSSEISGTRELKLVLEEKDELPRSKLSTVTNKLLASTAAFIRDIIFLYRLLRHPNTPWYAKGLLFFPVMYLCSPIQLIPNFIPVLGQMDDVLVIWVAKKVAVKFVGASTRKECQDAAAAVKLPRVMRREDDKSERAVAGIRLCDNTDPA